MVHDKGNIWHSPVPTFYGEVTSRRLLWRLTVSLLCRDSFLSTAASLPSLTQKQVLVSGTIYFKGLHIKIS